jgi:hypothetical protein
VHKDWPQRLSTPMRRSCLPTRRSSWWSSPPQ